MNIKNLLLIGVLLSVGIILLVLPPDYFDSGRSVCLSKNLFDMDCPGCGMTRAVMHLIHLDFKTAWIYNKLSYLMLPFLLYFYVVFILKLYRNLYRKTEKFSGKKTGLQ